MSNSYYTVSATIARNTLARAETVNSQLQSIAAGFDKLPAEDNLKQGRVTFVEGTGPANAYVVALSPAPLAYALGMHVAMKVPATNAAGACTLNANALGAKQVVRPDGAAPRAGDLAAGRVVEMRYDGVAFQIVSGLSAEAADAAASASSAATSATNAANSATAADGSKTSAASSATSASTSATNANTHATSADVSRQAAANSQTAAGNSQTAAANSATEALGYRNTASTHATTATTKAGEASTSATNAATSATNASNSATAAANSASSASTSASNAASSASQSATNAARVPAPTVAGYGLQAKADLSGYEEVGPVRAFRNKLINGAFSLWQRGTSFSASGHVADRWYWGLAAGAAGTLIRTAVGPGELYGGHNPAHALAWSRTATTGTDVIEQKIEDVRALSGRRVTLSFDARADAPGSIQVDVTQFFGDGGSPSPSVYVPVQSVAVTASLQRFKLVFDVPSALGKTLGTTGNDFTGVRFLFPASFGNFTNFILVNVQIEEGPVATPFESRPPAVELALCQRYYQRYTDLLLQGYNAGAAAIHNDFILPVEMRAAPTVGLTNTAASNMGSTSVNMALAAHIRLSATCVGTGYGYSISTMTLNAEL